MTNDEQLTELATTHDVSHLIVVCYRRQTDARHALGARVLERPPPPHTHTLDLLVAAAGAAVKISSILTLRGRDLICPQRINTAVLGLFRSK